MVILEVSTSPQFREHVRVMATRKALHQEPRGTIADVQRRMAVAQTSAMRGNRAGNKEAAVREPVSTTAADSQRNFASGCHCDVLGFAWKLRTDLLLMMLTHRQSRPWLIG